MLVGRVELGNQWKEPVQKLADSKKVCNVGILEGRIYPDEGEDAPQFIELNGETIPNPFRNSKGKSNLPVAQVAYWNEYGTEKIPSRPFFRNTIADKQEEWIKTVRVLMENNGLDWEDALNALGQKAAMDIQRTIEKGVTPDNSEFTKALKKAKGRAKWDLPLVDSGIMQDSIDYEVVDNDNGD